MGRLWKLKSYEPFLLDLLGLVLYMRQRSSYAAPFLFKTTLWLPSDLYCTFYISSKIKATGDALNVVLLGFSQCSTLRYVFVFHFYDRHSLA